jgi:hypothetical protein
MAMAYAICPRCEHTWEFQKRRGFRLKDAICPNCKCKGLRPAMKTFRGIVLMERGQAVERDIVFCALCGRRRDAAAGTIVTATDPFRVPGSRTPQRVFPAGTKYCLGHVGTELFQLDGSSATATPAAKIEVIGSVSPERLSEIVAPADLQRGFDARFTIA